MNLPWWGLTGPDSHFVLSMQPLLFLAEAQADAPSIWQVLSDNALLIALLFLFLAAIIGVILQQRRRDRCLKLFKDYHVCWHSRTGDILWGDLLVYPKAIELLFDTPYENRQGIVKNSALLYQAHFESTQLLVRVPQGLSDREAWQRRRPMKRCFRPSLPRRIIRWFRNLLFTLRDAVAQALSLVLGQIAKSRPGDSVLAQKKGQVEKIGQTLLGVGGNAFEAILERHIGRRVVLRVKMPGDEKAPTLEFAGALAEYTSEYYAVFGVDHEKGQTYTIEVDEAGREELGLKIDRQPDRIRITVTDKQPHVIHVVQSERSELKLEIAVMPGCSISLSLPGSGQTSVQTSVPASLDLVVPRIYSDVLFGGGEKTTLESHATTAAPSVLIEDA